LAYQQIFYVISPHCVYMWAAAYYNVDSPQTQAAAERPNCVGSLAALPPLAEWQFGFAKRLYLISFHLPAAVSK
jgi:hypothetical protein